MTARVLAMPDKNVKERQQRKEFIERTLWHPDPDVERRVKAAWLNAYEEFTFFAKIQFMPPPGLTEEQAKEIERAAQEAVQSGLKEYHGKMIKEILDLRLRVAELDPEYFKEGPGGTE